MLQNHNGLDHVIINVGAQLEAAAATYRRLGFYVTEPSRHNLGSVNQLMIFSPSYLELLSVPQDIVVRPELAAGPVGLAGIAFKTENADVLHAELASMGITTAPPLEVSRPVTVITGTHEARFRVVFLPPGILPGGRYLFCQHLTPQWVFRDGWRVHKNGAVGYDRIVIVVRDLSAVATGARRLFGDVVVEESERIVRLKERFVSYDFITREELVTRYKDVSLNIPEREDYMAALVVKVSLLDKVREALHAAGIAANDLKDRIIVMPEIAGGLTLEFVQASWIAWSPYRA